LERSSPPARVLQQLVQHIVQMHWDVWHHRPDVSAHDHIRSAPVRLGAHLTKWITWRVDNLTQHPQKTFRMAWRDSETGAGAFYWHLMTHTRSQRHQQVQAHTYTQTYTHIKAHTDLHRYTHTYKHRHAQRNARTHKHTRTNIST
jgi:hypothetical protein